MFRIKQNLSLVIPRVFPQWVDEEKIREVFHKQHFGRIYKVKIIRMKEEEHKRGHPVYKAFLYFSCWYDNEIAYNFQQRILTGKREARVVYDDPWHWVVFENTKKRISTVDRQLMRLERRIVTIENTQYQMQDTQYQMQEDADQQQHEPTPDDVEDQEQIQDLYDKYHYLNEQVLPEMQSQIQQLYEFINQQNSAPTQNEEETEFFRRIEETSIPEKMDIDQPFDFVFTPATQSRFFPDEDTIMTDANINDDALHFNYVVGC
jgi:hypothetical protein